MEDRPRTQARLRPTAAALSIFVVLDIKVAMVGSTAVQAVKALWLTRLFQSLFALRLRPSRTAQTTPSGSCPADYSC